VGDGSRQELQDAVTRIQRLADEYWYALDPMCHLLEERAWLGPEGSRLDSELHDARRELRAQLTKAVQSAQHKISSLPAP
jgi:hypothetical protein